MTRRYNRAKHTNGVIYTCEQLIIAGEHIRWVKDKKARELFAPEDIELDEDVKGVADIVTDNAYIAVRVSDKFIARG